MKYIPTDWATPYYNMALENMLMNDEQYDDEYVFFYIHKPSVIVGKHQNTLQEINYKFITENDIIIARRITGGGAVYHDNGNLNYSFVFNRRDGDTIDFEPYTRPVIKALESLGVKSELSGRNDILIDGRKFSGTAQYMNKRKVLSHGTLMFDLNIENMVNALNVDNLKIESKAITSVKSRVANLVDYLSSGLDIFTFRQHLIDSFFKGMKMQTLELDSSEIEKINQSVKDKFSSWDHNYGNSPAFNTVKKKKFEAGIIEAGINVEHGIITQIRFTGDFFVNEPIDVLERILTGVKFEEKTIRNLKELNNIISGITIDNLAELLFY